MAEDARGRRGGQDAKGRSLYEHVLEHMTKGVTRELEREECTRNGGRNDEEWTRIGS